MKPRDIQFDLRKNPDSPRVHGLRFPGSGPSHVEQKETQSEEEAPPGNAARMLRTFELPLSNAPSRAAGGRREDPGRLLTVEEVAEWLNVKPQVDEIEFPDGKRIILLSEGRLVKPWAIPAS